MARIVRICFTIWCIILLITKINAQTNVTEAFKPSELVPEATNQTEAPPKTNENSTKENKTIEMHRITQPITESHSSTHSIGRTLLPVRTNTSNNPPNGGLNIKPAEFKPSPQVNTYYEYNRFPVAPAFPEAKNFPGIPAFPEAKNFPGINLNEKPIRSETVSWFDRPITNFPTTTQQPWYNKINFPTTQNPFLNVRDQPYPYLITNGYPETTTKSQYPYVITGTYPDTTRSQYPFVITGTNSETTTRNPGFSKYGGFPLGNGAGHGNAQGGPSNKFGGFDKGGLFDKGGFFGDKGSLFGGDKGSLFGGGKGGLGGTGGGGGSPLTQKTHYEQPYSLSAPGGSSGSPWKKIIKFLTAIIPIGLLISALTPTIINVSPMNMTQGRGRAEDHKNIAAEKLIASLNYINKLTSAGCEERVVCELLMGARVSANGEQHIENLLAAFTEQERDVIDRIDELSKIFEAARSGECSSLACDGIPENTKHVASVDKGIEE